MATIVTAGITLHEALDAQESLSDNGLNIRVIDLYSIKSVDSETLVKAAEEIGVILLVEDHYAGGGIGNAVFSALRGTRVTFEHLAVTKTHW